MDQVPVAWVLVPVFLLVVFLAFRKLDATLSTLERIEYKLAALVDQGETQAELRRAGRLPVAPRAAMPASTAPPSPSAPPFRPI